MMMQAEEWNELYPVGTRVRYYPVADEPGYVDTHTRSVAWTLGSGHVVVKVDGQTGGVSVEHLVVAGPIVIGYLFGDKRPLDGMSDELLVEVAAWCIEESVRRDASYAALPQSTVDWANAILERRRAEQPRSCSPQTSTERVKAEAAARGPLPASIIGCWPGDETDEELLQGLDELRR